MKKSYYLLTGFIAATVVLSATNALASSAAVIEAGASGPVTYDNGSGAYPVVSAVLSQPGSFGGHTYTGWSFLAQDSTGSMDIFASATALTGFGYSPTVGDAISVSGTYSPFHQIPEIETLSAIAAQSSGNTVPTPPAFTVSQLNQSTLPFNIAGYYIQLNDVTIGGTGGVGGLFPTYAQATTATETFTVTDGTGTMTLFDWVTSYSTDGAMVALRFQRGQLIYLDLILFSRRPVFLQRNLLRL